MLDFIGNCILWTLALYGLIDIIKIIKEYFIHKRIESNGIFFILAVKNQEQRVEFLLRSIIIKILHSKEEHLQNVIVTDLNSIDNTKSIIEKFSSDNPEIKVIEWEKCKELIDSYSSGG